MKRTALFYRSNPDARKKRLKQQAEYNKRPDQVSKRVELTKINRKNHKAGKSKVGDGKDVSHRIDGSTFLENKHTNRARKTRMIRKK